MRSLARMELEDGGSILFEAAPEVFDGPVKAGRVSEAIQEPPSSLQSALTPVPWWHFPLNREIRDL
ncbi:hypothetical protein [Streptomyces sp. NPDC088358]|uniref:hypothetical protein n=1 Tax=Streptomyces sp. NPDC088358 TaxID=3365857 RepID=UPI0038250FDF